MEQLRQWMENASEGLRGFVWGPVMLCVLLGIGLYFSIGTGFLQLRRFGYIWRHTVGTLLEKRPARGRQTGGISPFQALTTALAGTAGIGNIVGVAAAITAGGPGAIFWMWLSAVLGMMTKYAEILLAVRYRHKNERGEYVGGPMFYLAEGVGSRFLALAFSAFGVCACMGIGNMTQVNSMALAAQESFGVPPLATGLAVAALAGAVIVGGQRSIARFTEKLVPFMALGYLAACGAVLLDHLPALPGAVSLIFESAFHPMAAAGGFGGAALRQIIGSGISKGVFSNEAGMGSASIAHAAAETDHPVKQAFWGVFEVFLDTLVMCSCTALVILATGAWQGEARGAALTIAAFAATLGDAASPFITVAIFCFAFATLVSWCLYGERCLAFLAGTDRYARAFRFLFLGFAVVGATTRLELVWSLSDAFNGLMMIPNLAGLLLLSGVVFSTTRQYFSAASSSGPPNPKSLKFVNMLEKRRK